MTVPSAIINKFETGPKTYQVKSAVVAGQCVQYATGTPTEADLSLVEPAAANSRKFAGVAVRNASPNADLTAQQNFTSPDGYPTFYAGRMSNATSVIKRGQVPLKYAANANYGDKLKLAANGGVTPSAADGSEVSLEIGTCEEPLGVASGAWGQTWINVR